MENQTRQDSWRTKPTNTSSCFTNTRTRTRDRARHRNLRSGYASMVEIFRMKYWGTPQPKQRPRFVMIKGKPKVYTPKQTRAFEIDFAKRIRLCSTKRPATDKTPIKLRVEAIWQRPKTRPKWITKEQWQAKSRLYRPCLPDADNVLKAVCDAVQMSHLIYNDSQVVDKRVRCFYGAPQEKPHILLVLHEVDLIYSETRGGVV